MRANNNLIQWYFIADYHGYSNSQKIWIFVPFQSRQPHLHEHFSIEVSWSHVGCFAVVLCGEFNIEGEQDKWVLHDRLFLR